MTKEQNHFKAPETERPRLVVGDVMPDVAFQDIDGSQSSTGKLRNRIQVVSFANQQNATKLRGWLREAGLKVARDYPELDVVHVGFADVSGTPKMLQRMVKPLLRTINDISKLELESAYGHSDVLHLAPDWDGGYMKQFGLKRSEKYTCWVVARGTIVASFEEDTPRLEEKFINLFNNIANSPSPYHPS